jgi:parallel beta-helix repeat protein
MKRVYSIALALALVLGFTLVMAVPVAAATTWYVDAANCPGPGTGSAGDPFCTIQAAVSAASSGDTVYVRAGTYYEHVTIDKSLTLQGEDRNTTIVDGSGSGNVIYVTANYVTICGLTATNGGYGIYLIPNWSIHHITVTDVVIDLNSQVGFSAPHSGGYHLIEDCIISNSGGGASYAHQFGNSIIRNCEVFGNGGALSVAHGSNTQIANNIVHHNGAGIHFDSMSNSVIENNIVHNNTAQGISTGYVASGNTIRDNIVYDNGTGIFLDTSAGGDRVYHNDLIGNTIQARDKQYTGIWDNGYPSGGNYWSDYVGVDSFSGAGQNVPGSDGIGDTPYTLTGNQDNYPLMEARRIGCVTTATGTGTACFTTSDGVIEDLTAVATPSGAPVQFPHGMFSFRVTGLSTGQTITLDITLPSSVPVATKWYKYNAGAWDPLPIGDDDGDNFITVALTDGDPIDDEDAIAGQITDQGGPGGGAVGWETYPTNKVRVLLPWIALMIALMGGAGWYIYRRRMAQR